MSGDTIKYKSGRCNFSRGTNVLEARDHNNGIECTWTRTVPNGQSAMIMLDWEAGAMDGQYNIDFAWEFNWSKIKNQGVDELIGHITVYSANGYFTATKIDVNLTEDNQVITKKINSNSNSNTVHYEYSLTPHYAPITEKPDYDKMFAPSDKNDAILIVNGKKLHVSKAFLSYHSEYFSSLFSSNYKEGQMNEIPIKDVSYEDFALLLSSFYPNPVFPTDKTIEKLLEMASRFMVSSVISISEYHLLNNSRINSEKMLWMADEYVMQKLFEKCLRGLNTSEKAKKLKQSTEFKKLSDSAKAKVLDRLINLF